MKHGELTKIREQQRYSWRSPLLRFADLLQPAGKSGQCASGGALPGFKNLSHGDTAVHTDGSAGSLTQILQHAE